MSYSVTTPTKAFNYNADQEDGRTYTWDVTVGEDQTLELEFHVLDMTKTLVVAGVGVVALFVALFVVKRKVKQKRESAELEE